jgi:hypothetical protein
MPCEHDQPNWGQRSATPTAKPAGVSANRNTVTPSCVRVTNATSSPRPRFTIGAISDLVAAHSASYCSAFAEDHRQSRVDLGVALRRARRCPQDPLVCATAFGSEPQTIELLFILASSRRFTGYRLSHLRFAHPPRRTTLSGCFTE